MLLACGSAQAQQQIFNGLTQVPPTGNPIGVGQGIRLFAQTTMASEVSAPFTFSLWTLQPPGGSLYPLLNNGNSALAPSGISNADPFYLEGYVNSAGTGCAGGSAARLCTRLSNIQTNTWHHLCAVYNASGITSFLYLDGRQVDHPSSLGSYTPSLHFWQMNTAGASMRDVGVYSRALSAAECQLAFERGILGFDLASGNAGSLATGLVAWWNLDPSTCTGSGSSLLCADGSGNNNPAGPDSVPPVVVITSPSPGGASGTITLQASCTDTIACAGLTWSFDAVQVGAVQTVSPYTVTVDTTQYVDGTHVISAVGVNAGGFPTTATPVTVTTSNSVSAKTVYISGAGSDSNNGLTSGTPIQTCPHLYTSFVLHGGDQVLFDAANPVTLNNPTNTTGNCSFLGASTDLVGSTRNVFGTGSGYPLIISSYGGSGSCVPITGNFGTCATINVTGTSWGGAANFAAVEAINVPFITIENLRINGTSNPAALTGGGYGITCGAAENVVNTNCTIQNNEVVDFDVPILGAQTVSQLYGTLGTMGNMLIQNNWVHGSTPTVAGQNGVLVLGVALGSNVIQGNLIEQMGGHAGSGSGIQIANGSANWTNQFNVTRNNGRNSTGCGSGYGNWAYQTTNIVWQFNELYGQGPHPYVTGCDMGGYDFDGGVTFSTAQYSYIHDNQGPAFNLYTAIGPWSNNTVRYNIAEHNSIGVSNEISLAASGSYFVYNNTVWASTGLQTTSGAPDRPLSIGVFCPSAFSVIANNIMATVNVAGVAPMADFGTLTCSNVNFKANDWYSIQGGAPQWLNWGSSPTATSLPAWQALAPGGDTGAITANPQFVSPGADLTCYPGGVIPAGPQNQPSGCPGGYVVSSPSSPVIGTGIDLTQAPFSLNVGTQDYYGNSIPHTHGSGFNMGSYGGYP